MSFVQTEVEHLPLIVRNYPTKYLYTITFNSMVASEDENNKKKTLFKEKNLIKKWSKNGSTNRNMKYKSVLRVYWWNAKNRTISVN